MQIYQLNYKIYGFLLPELFHRIIMYRSYAANPAGTSSAGFDIKSLKSEKSKVQTICIRYESRILKCYAGSAEGAGRILRRNQSFHSTPDLVSLTSKPRAARRSRIRSEVVQSFDAFAFARISIRRSTAPV